MKLGINGATTMPYPLEDDIRSAARAGFASIEIWYGKLQSYLREHSIEQLKELIDETKLEVAALCPTGIRAFSGREQSLAELRQAAELAQRIGCGTLLACPDVQPDGMSKSEALAAFAAAAGEAADIADSYGVRIALEPLGRHPLIDGPTAALDVIAQADRPNLGLMIDTFHYYKSDVSFGEIEDIPVYKLYIVHINDCDDLPKHELQDKDRVYPTLGVIPAVRMLKPLADKGYTGTLSVEVFRPSYWETPIEEINRRAFETGSALLRQLKEE